MNQLIPPNALDDYCLILLAKNAELKHEACLEYDKFYNSNPDSHESLFVGVIGGKNVQCISYICDHLKLDEEVKYFALELFNKASFRMLRNINFIISNLLEEFREFFSLDSKRVISAKSPALTAQTSTRFNQFKKALSIYSLHAASKLIRDLHISKTSSFNLLSSTENNVLDKWETFLHHFYSNVEQYAVLSISLSCKYLLHRLDFSFDRLEAVLGRSVYKNGDNNNTEMLIFHLLDFNLNNVPCAYRYMKCFLIRLQTHIDNFNIDHIQALCNDFLVLFYFYRSKILQELWTFNCQQVQQSPTTMIKQSFTVKSLSTTAMYSCKAEMSCDMALIASAVIASAVYVSSVEISDAVNIYLQDVTGIPVVYIGQLAYFILKSVGIVPG